MTVQRVNIPVNFDLSFLKIRWSDHLIVKDGKKILGEGVVYGGNWEKAERLARQMALMKFGAKRGSLKICEQIFIQKTKSKKQRAKIKVVIDAIRNRWSNLKIKVGRNVIEDIKVIEFICRDLQFPNQIRLDANQGYSLKQLQYLIPTMKQYGIEYIEEPVRVGDIPAAYRLLHGNGLKLILDESLSSKSALISVIKFIDVINIKLARVGDVKASLNLIKLAKKHRLQVVIGCAEELDRGMEAIYALGNAAKKAGVLLEAEGFGPLRLASSEASPLRLQHTAPAVPRLINKCENAYLILGHRCRQLLFDLYWSIGRGVLLLIKQSKKLSSLSLHLVKLTGKHPQPIHPKHLIKSENKPDDFILFIQPQDKVLDIGCGNGQQSLRAAAIAKQVIGFDYDKRQLDLARNEAKRRGLRNIEFDKLSAEIKLPYSKASFDKVMFFGVLEHLWHRNRAMTEIYRILKPRGEVLLGVPHEMTSWKLCQWRFGIPHFTDPDHKVEYSKEGILQFLSKHQFKVKVIKPTAYDTPGAGFIDVIGGISLPLYRRMMEWKWKMAQEYPRESISFFIVADKI